MQEWLNRIIAKASWCKAVCFTMLFAVLYLSINFSAIGQAGLLELTDGANMLDMYFGYNHSQAFQILSDLGAEGRTFYLTRIVPQDALLPLIYLLFFSELIALLLKHSNLSAKAARFTGYLLLIPVLAAVFDWLENIGTVTMTLRYPDLPAWAVYLASFSGMMKAVFTILSVATIILLLALWLLQRLSSGDRAP